MLLHLNYHKYYIQAFPNREKTNMKSLALAIFILSVTALALLIGFSPHVRAEGNVVMLSHTIYQTYGFPPFSVNKGDYLIAGEVQNEGTQALNFNITDDFYNSNGEIITSAFLTDSLTDSAPSYLHVLLPGEKSPFVIYLSRFDNTGNFRLVDHYDLRITSSNASNFRSGFHILSESSHQIAGTLFIDGEVKNIGANYIDGFNVFATFYNDSGEVVSVTSEGGTYTRATPGEGFAPNQTTTFSVKLDDFPEGGRLQRVNRYKLTVEGYNYSLWTADGHLISPEIVYVLGSVNNQIPEPEPENSPFILYVVVIATIGIIVALLIIFMKRRSKKEKVY
jgi:hypothetical protein